MTSLTIAIEGDRSVSALLCIPGVAKAGLVLAHGAGAGMTHPFMDAVASGLAERGVATLRYQFLYMERGSRRPDPATLATSVVRAAVSEATKHLQSMPLFAGGKSFGGRMTSEAQARQALPCVQGLVFFGFPLHPARKPSITRAEHLSNIGLPMLFLQGGRDALADTDLLISLVGQIGEAASLHVVDDADHSFHVPARSGRGDGQVLDELLDHASEWMLRPKWVRAARGVGASAD